MAEFTIDTYPTTGSPQLVYVDFGSLATWRMAAKFVRTEAGLLHRTAPPKRHYELQVTAATSAQATAINSWWGGREVLLIDCSAAYPDVISGNLYISNASAPFNIRNQGMTEHFDGVIIIDEL